MALERSLTVHGRLPGPGALPGGQPRGRHAPGRGRRGGPLPGGGASPSTSTPWPPPATYPSTSEVLGADLVSVSSHKLGGPAGVGALDPPAGPARSSRCWSAASRSGGGGPDSRTWSVPSGSGRRPRHWPTPGTWTAKPPRPRRQTERLAAAATGVDGVVPFGDVERRVPHILCLGVAGVEAEPVLLGLDQAGVAVHSGSSCSSESLEPSPVLEAMGVDGERSLRLSVGWSTTDDRRRGLRREPSPGSSPACGPCAA